MLIRVSGYNTGAQEYLEQGNKSGREFTRDELDHRLIIEGQLSVTGPSMKVSRTMAKIATLRSR